MRLLVRQILGNEVGSSFGGWGVDAGNQLERWQLGELEVLVVCLLTKLSVYFWKGVGSVMLTGRIVCGHLEVAAILEVAVKVIG